MAFWAEKLTRFFRDWSKPSDGGQTIIKSFGERVTIPFTIAAHIESAEIIMPEYINARLKRPPRLTSDRNNHCILELDFGHTKRDKDNRYLKKAIAEIIQDRFGDISVENENGKTVQKWLAGDLNKIAYAIDYLANPEIEFKIKSRIEFYKAQLRIGTEPVKTSLIP